MLKSITLPSSSSGLFEAIDLPRSKYSPRSPSQICCSSSRSHIPKLQPFSRSKIERGIKEPSIIEKSETEITDYCSVLEGDDSYNCWRAYFELKSLERELSKDEVEKLIRQTDGVKSLIDCVHGVAEIHKRKNEKIKKQKPLEVEMDLEKECPVPDGLPRSEKEIEEEEKGRMPDSPFTRLLRTKGRFPAWFSQAPDHETD